MTKQPQTTKFIRKYFKYPDGREEWCVSSDHGSLSFWVCESPMSELHGAKYYGGVESHYNQKSKPEYLGDGSHHKGCLQNGGECWHDGTSLWASEYWIPFILPGGDERIWENLEYEYAKRMRPEVEEAA